jgi:DNA-binding NtrC family response regulator
MPETTKILVVDDEEMMRDFLLEVFAEHEPLGAADGEEALELLAQQSFDLVISDLKMPGVDGLELLRRIKERDQGTEVIIITGFASRQTASDCVTAGAAEFLRKPFTINQIKKAVDKVLGA